MRHYAEVPISEIILILNELFSEFDRAADLVWRCKLTLA